MSSLRKMVRIAAGVIVILLTIYLLGVFGVVALKNNSFRLSGVLGFFITITLCVLFVTVRSKGRYVIALVMVVAMLASKIPIETYGTDYGGCDIGDAEVSLSVIAGESIEDAREKRRGCYSYITYRLYLL